jgi:hypothetical protein
METIKTYERFPARIILFSGSFSLLIYSCGLFIMIRLGWIIALIFLAFILTLEIRAISKHCVNCYYWGKLCGFGKGWISSLFFKKGDPIKFCEKDLSWKDMIPDLLVSLIPLITAIVLFIISFNFLILIAAVLLTALSTIGNQFIRGSLTCKYCKQRENGCPAEELFRKKK